MRRKEQTNIDLGTVYCIAFFIFELIGGISGLVFSCLSATPSETILLQIAHAAYFIVCGMIMAVIALGGVVFVGAIVFVLAGCTWLLFD